MQKWTKLYHDAMAESSATKPWMLDDAIDAVLDQIEDTLTRPNSQRGDLTRALNELRSRRREIHSENRPIGGQSNHRAA